MKKFLKIMAIIIAIGAAVAAVIIYLKNNGYLVFKEDEEDEENDFPIFDDVAPKKRKYVSILPIKKFCKEENKENDSIDA